MHALARRNPALTVEVTEKPTSKWWECYGNGDGVGEESLAIRKKICDAIQVECSYALVLQEGHAIAVGSAAREREWIGFFNIATRPEHRRVGAAQTVMNELAKWGLMTGASKTYIQVMADNVAAVTLYSHLGFTTEYYYYYREEVTAL
jgi:ribosomal protein S18 acetylase RimI-like enzyme